MKKHTNLYFIISIISLLLFSCKEEQEVTPVFKIPTIINNDIKDTSVIKTYKACRLTFNKPIYLGKFQFADTIDITKKRGRQEINNIDRFSRNRRSYPRDSLAAISSNGFDFVIDYNTNNGIPCKSYRNVWSSHV